MQDKTSTAIAIRGLAKTFDGLIAVDHIDLEIASGEFFGLLGPNGAGKTTLIRMLVGLCNPSAGSASIFGRDVVKEANQSRQLIGVAPQEYNFDENLRVKEILTYHAGYYGMQKKEREARAEEILKFLEIEDKAGEYCNKLSGGMKRRLLIGRALMQNPKVLFLDEPTTGVDVQLRRTLWKMLKELNSAGTTIVLTTHYIEEAENLCSRVAIMDQGKIIAMGSPELLKRTEVDTNTIEFDIGSETVPEIKGIAELIRYSVSQGKLVAHVTDTGIASVKILDFLKAGKITVKSMHVRESTLEDVFIKLTGRDMHG
jgi:ABC-2 type transport system ATP-binding protein